MDRVIARLLAHGRIQAARKQLERGDAETLAHQVELSAIPAPTGEETARGARGAALPLRRPVLFAATVGEEGSGDLRGIRHLLRPPPDGVKPCAAIALDGAGVERVVHRALGSRRYRVTYRGPGGHSWAAFGVANAANAVGRAAAGLADLVVPDEPRTSCTVARIGGGNR